MYDIIIAIVLGIIEGITEFLPVSSTGHLFLAGKFGLGFRNHDKAFFEAFAIFIQIGAILAVAIYFRRRIIDLVAGQKGGAGSSGSAPRRRAGMTPLEISQAVSSARSAAASSRPSVTSAATVAGPGLEPMPEYEVAAVDARLSAAQRWRVLIMIAVGTVPVLVAGLLTHKWVKEHLEESAPAIATALLVGGLLMLLIEMLPINVSTQSLEEITLPQAIGVGLAQILAAVFPGTSRSAATILGGMVGGISRPAAAEFSFFLAIPAMCAACGYSMLKWIRENHPTLDDFLLFGVGTVVSFIVAWIVIAAFMAYIRKRSFVPFAIYRIAIGAIVLAVWYFRRG